MVILVFALTWILTAEEPLLPALLSDELAFTSTANAVPEGALLIKVEWACGCILVRDGANAGWINYMLNGRQKSEFDGFFDCIIIGSPHNPIADA